MAVTGKDASGSTVSLKSTTDGSDEVIHHNIDTCALPTGAATEATLASIDDSISGVLSGNAVGVGLASLSFQSEFESATGWSASAGADSLATTTTHVGVGVNFLTFNKISGNVLAMISKSLSPAVDASAYGLGADGYFYIYLPSLTNVVSVSVRFGTDSSNYHQWDWAVADLAAGWNILQAPVSSPTSQTGAGYNLAAASFMAFGVTYSASGNTASGIIVGGATLRRRTTPDLSVESVVTSANINIAKVAGHAVSVGSGNLTNATQRVAIATDDVNMSATSAVLGTTSGSKVITDETGTVQQYLRGLIYLLITSGQALVTATIAAGTALIGKASVAQDTATIYSGTTALTPKFAVISAASSGDNTIVAGVTSKKIRVLSLFLCAKGTANTLYFRENTSGTAIFGDGTNTIPIDKTGATGPAGFSLGFNPVGWMQSSSGNPLVLNLSAAQGVAGGLTYIEV